MSEPQKIAELVEEYSDDMKTAELRSWAKRLVRIVKGATFDGDGVPLTSLVGIRELDAVNFSSERVRRYSDEYEDAQVCCFRLDGKTYAAVEDPSDGYRSSLSKLLAVDDRDMENVFPPIKVLGVYRNKRESYHECDIIEFVDTITGRVVLEIGTDNSGDYYPSYVAAFHPEAMATNAGVQP